MKKRIIITLAILSAFAVTATAGIVDAVVQLAEDSGIEVLLNDMKVILQETKDQQGEEIGTNADMDVYNKLAEFYDKIAEQSVHQLQDLYAFAQQAVENGDDSQFWEQEISDYITSYRNRSVYGEAGFSIKDITDFIKMKGVSKEAKLKYMQDCIDKLDTYYGKSQIRLINKYNAQLNSTSMSRAIEELNAFILEDDPADHRAREAAADLESSKSIFRKIISLLLIGVGITGLVLYVPKYLKGGEAHTGTTFIKIIIGLVLGLVGLAVILV